VQAGTPSGGAYALNVEGTLNTDASVRGGSNFDFIANGGSGVRYGAQYYLHGTFSANSPTRAFAADNRLPGTGANLFSTTQQFNLGVLASAGNVAGGVTNVGIAGYGSDGSTLSVGVLGFSYTGSNTAGPNRIGVIGVADTTAVATNIVGGYFGLAAQNSANPTFTSSALIADNGSQAVPIFLARDNGTEVFRIADGGNVGIGTNAPVAAIDIASGQAAIPDGSAAAPSLAFRDDLNTGLFSPANDVVGVAVNGTEVARFNQSGAGSTPVLLMGTTSVIGAITVDSSDPSGTAGVGMIAHAAAGTAIQESFKGGQFAGLRTRGTKGAPTQIGADDGLLNMIGAGYTATGGYNYGALVTFKAEQAYTAAASGGRIEFHTTTNGTDGITTLGGSTTERMRIANSGNVGIGTSTPSSKLSVAGSLSLAITTISTGTTLDATHYTVLCDTSGGGFTVTLPAAATCAGRVYVVKNKSTNTATVQGNGAETIDGSNTYALSAQWQSVTIQSDGTAWYRIGQ